MNITDDSIKEILYNELDNMGKDYTSLLSSKGNPSELVDIICKRTIPKVLNICGDNSVHALAVLATGILHYILTNYMIPSQRKITHKEEEIDIVIPNLQTLIKDPNNAIIIMILDDYNDTLNMIQSNIQRLSHKLQLPQENIWLVSSHHINIQSKIFVMGDTFPSIIFEINHHIKSKKLSSPLNIFKIE
jgi:hypothetical protein